MARIYNCKIRAFIDINSKLIQSMNLDTNEVGLKLALFLGDISYNPALLSKGK